MSTMEQNHSLYDIAIIGLVGRFPGANDVDHFWDNLRNGVESITFFSDEELLAAGVESELLRNPNYVKANGILADIACFDAPFFGITPREATLLDPQQRLLLEAAWHALEQAGYDAERYEGRIGVYAGASMNTYLLYNLMTNPQAISGQSGRFQALISNDKDFLATRISYRLNLHGPSVTVQTACSTSLVAVHMACQGLLNRECDLALAGGVSGRVPQVTGYLYEPGHILSPDGHCRPFDARAQGTLGGNGLGIVALKRLADALEERDTIHAVIKGSAINNDGARKIGYTAPSEEGQVEAITEAMAMAAVPAESITYVETHGTGTTLGDPIEMAALTRAFRASTDKSGFCAIGAVKSNIGHLDAAAGVAGLIKTVLALKHRQLPPSLHFTAPNPKIDFANSPFYVNTALKAWDPNGYPRRAGVSSFGIGGTNAHVVVEEAPVAPPSDPGRGDQVILLSAHTEEALEQATDNLAAYLRQHPALNLADVAYTLQLGRRAFAHRRAVVCRDVEEAATALEKRDPRRVLTAYAEARYRPVVFMFPGQGAQYVNMGREVYESEPVFRTTIEQCVSVLEPLLGFNLLEVLYPASGGEKAATDRLTQTALTQPAVFVVEYALAQLWQTWGVQPQALIGHSLGELVAACLAGVFSLDQALNLVVQRGRLIQRLPGGSMLSVPLSEADVQPFLTDEVALAAVNSPRLCALSGPDAAMEALHARLESQGVPSRWLQTSHAFHSAMMEPVVAEFAACVERADLHPPTMPFVSNVSGTWITTGEATDPTYWAKHVRQPVRFAEGVQTAFTEEEQVFLEVGPGQTLSTLVRQQQAQIVRASLPHPRDKQTARGFLLTTLGQLWLAGLEIDWQGFHDQKRRRVPLPLYPFARERYWMDPGRPMEQSETPQQLLKKTPDMTDWFYLPAWKPTLPPVPDPQKGPGRWLIFRDEDGMSAKLASRLQAHGDEVVTVLAGEQFTANATIYTLRPASREDYDKLLTTLGERDRMPTQIVHGWSLAPPNAEGDEVTDTGLQRSFSSLLCLAQALGARNLKNTLPLSVLSSHMQYVVGDELIHPEKAALLGPCKVIPQEIPQITCRSIDIALPETGSRQEAWLIEQLIVELKADTSDSVIAYRGHDRLVRTYEPVSLTEVKGSGKPRLREGGVYLITGGLGGIGLTLAKHVAQTMGVKLILTGRSTFPAKDTWEALVSSYSGDEDIRRTIEQLQELETLGAEVLVLTADVANQQQMEDVIQQAERRFGGINGVIHAAGVADGAMIQRRTREMSEKVFWSKVTGTLVLDRVLKGRDLDFLVLCSSLSSSIGGVGQVAYSAANAFLDAYACYKGIQDTTFTISINWDRWLEVGMAVETQEQLAKRHSLAGARSEPVSHPLFETRRIPDEEQVIYESNLSVEKFWILNEHRVLGKPTLPGTALLEMARAAFEDYTGQPGIEMRDVHFIVPLRMGEKEEKQVRTILSRREEGFEFSIVSQITSHEGQWVEHGKGKIANITEEPAKRHDIKEIEARCYEQEVTMAEQWEAFDKEFADMGLVFGPRWHNLQQTKLGTHQGLAMQQLPEEFADDLDAYKLHPALLDTATGFMLNTVKDEGNYLPLSYKKLCIKAPLTSIILSYNRYRENPLKKDLSFNITIMDETGRELVDVEEFTIRKMEMGELPRKQPTARGHTSAQNVMEGFQETFEYGLLPSEGAEVFSRILQGVTLPRIAVSTTDLITRITQDHTLEISQSLKTLKKTSSPGTIQAWAELSTRDKVPKNEIEQMLANVFQDFLGIEKIGLDDNFYELGASSLDLVQISTTLKDIMNVDISVVTMFTNPTIRALAEHLTQEEAEDDSVEDPETGRYKLQQRRTLIEEEDEFN